jgi:hypothetical protein
MVLHKIPKDVLPRKSLKQTTLDEPTVPLGEKGEKNMARIQFELTEGQLMELENLMAECGMRTKKDLLNNSLSLLEWVLNEKKSGRIVASIEEKENKYVFRELVLPLLKSCTCAA